MFLYKTLPMGVGFLLVLWPVSRPFSTWLTMTDIRRSPVLRWPEQDELRHTMPLCLQFSFGKNHHYY